MIPLAANQTTRGCILCKMHPYRIFSIALLYCVSTFLVAQGRPERTKFYSIDIGRFSLRHLEENDNFLLRTTNFNSTVTRYIQMRDVLTKAQSNSLSKECGILTIHNPSNSIGGASMLSSSLSRLRIDTLIEVTTRGVLSYKVHQDAFKATLRNPSYSFNTLYGGHVNISHPVCGKRVCKFWVSNSKDIDLTEDSIRGELTFENLDHLDLSSICATTDDCGALLCSKDSLKFNFQKHYRTSLNLAVDLADGSPRLDDIVIDYNQRVVLSAGHSCDVTMDSTFTFTLDSLALSGLRFRFTRDSIHYDLYDVDIFCSRVRYKHTIDFDVQTREFDIALKRGVHIDRISGSSSYSNYAIDWRNTILYGVNILDAKIAYFRDNSSQKHLEANGGNFSIKCKRISRPSIQARFRLSNTAIKYEDIAAGSTGSLFLDDWDMTFSGRPGHIEGYGFARAHDLAVSVRDTIDGFSVPLPQNLSQDVRDKLYDMSRKEDDMLVKSLEVDIGTLVSMFDTKQIFHTNLDFKKPILYDIHANIHSLLLDAQYVDGQALLYSHVNNLDAQVHFPEHRDEYNVNLGGFYAQTSLVTKSKNVLEKFGFLGRLVSRTVFWQEEVITRIFKRVDVPIKLHIPESTIDATLKHNCFAFTNHAFEKRGGNVASLSPMLNAPSIHFSLPFGGDWLKGGFDEFVEKTGVLDPVGVAMRVAYNSYVALLAVQGVFVDTSNRNRYFLQKRVFKNCSDLDDVIGADTKALIQDLQRTPF